MKFAIRSAMRRMVTPVPCKSGFAMLCILVSGALAGCANFSPTTLRSNSADQRNVNPDSVAAFLRGIERMVNNEGVTQETVQRLLGVRLVKRSETKDSAYFAIENLPAWLESSIATYSERFHYGDGRGYRGANFRLNPSKYCLRATVLKENMESEVRRRFLQDHSSDGTGWSRAFSIESPRGASRNISSSFYFRTDDSCAEQFVVHENIPKAEPLK